MIELTPDDVAVILRLAATQALDHLPVAQLNDEGQTEIVGWIETVGRMDDQLSPYAWFSLAEEAASSNEPSAPIVIEMLPTYTLSGDYETLELCRLSHFDWSIDAVPVELIENVDDLLDTGAPVHFLLLAETGGIAFAKRVREMCPGLAAQKSLLTAHAINACFARLCDSVGIMPDPALAVGDHAGLSMDDIEDAQLDLAIAAGNEAASDAMRAIASDIDLAWPAIPTWVDRDALNAGGQRVTCK